VPAVRTGNLVFLAGHLPWDKSGKVIAGQVGRDVDVPVAYEVAKLITLGLLATLRAQIGLRLPMVLLLRFAVLMTPSCPCCCRRRPGPRAADRQGHRHGQL
jgi:hypothetical protein